MWQVRELKLEGVVEAEYTTQACGGLLYNMNLHVKGPTYEGVIQMMVWKGVIWKTTKISPLGTKPPPPGSRHHIMHQTPELKKFALEELCEKLKGMGALIDRPNNTLMPILAWDSRCLKRRSIGAGFDNNFEHSIVVRVKPPRGKKSKPGLHGLWKLTIRERRWIRTFSFQEAARLKRGIRAVQQTTFPSARITHDGRPTIVIKTLVEEHHLLLECPLMVTLALFALDTHNMKNKEPELKFERVLRALRRKASGSTYLLTLEASYHGTRQTYMTSVTEVPWLRFLESTPLVKHEKCLPKVTSSFCLSLI